jgi:hypothetical protein
VFFCVQYSFWANRDLFSPWDQDGDLLAVITDKSANLLVWDANNSKSQWLDTGQLNSVAVLTFF